MPGLRVGICCLPRTRRCIGWAKVTLLVCTNKEAVITEMDKNGLKILIPLLNSAVQCLAFNSDYVHVER